MSVIDALSHWSADTSIPVVDKTIGDMLRMAAESAPDRIALIEGDAGRRRRWTYAALFADAERIAGGLSRRFSQGERLALFAPNSPEWILVELGAALAGLTLVTINPGLRGEELKYALRQSRAAGICCADDYKGHQIHETLAGLRTDLPELREVLPLQDWQGWASGEPPARHALPVVTPDDVAMIIFTSGTTGLPKGAMLRHRGLVNNYRFNVARLGMDHDDVFVSPIPLFHVGGACMAVLTALAAQCTFVVVERVSPGLMLDLIESERATVMIGVPTMFLDMLGRLDGDFRDISSMRLIMVGGSVVPPPLIRTLEHRFGASVRNSYGQTESGSIICATEGGDSAATISETVGRPFPHAEVRIVDANGRIAPLGEPGELCLRGYQVMAGYVGMSDETAATIDDAGWLHTGDVCTMDREGRVRVVGRIKEMIIRGGENLFPKEIEDSIRAHPAVLDVAVIGVTDPRLGEDVAAFVRTVPSGGFTIDEMRAFLGERLSPEKIPAHWRFVDAFPMTTSGKVYKPGLREIFEGAPSSAA